MADTIPQHFTTEFSTNWIQRVQQTKARLDAFVVDESFMGERKRYDRISAQTSRLRTERKGPTVSTDPTLDFRWAYRQSYDIANTLDKDDALNLGQLVLPTSDYVAGHAAAYNRDCDDVAWKAALGTVITGELGTTETAFPTSTNWIGVGGAIGASTGTAVGLTLAKLLLANEILGGADLDDEAPRVIVCGAKQLNELLNTTEVKSADYNTVKALAAGQIDTFMGFKFVKINRLTLASEVRTCVCWVKGAIRRIKGSMTSQIDRLPTQSQAVQIYSAWNLGAVRVYDEGVVQIDCKSA